MKQLLNFLWRSFKKYFGLIILFFVTIIFGNVENELFRLLFTITSIVALSIIFGNIALRSFAKIDFSPGKEDTKEEILAKIIASSIIFVGICILVAGCVFGMYYLFFAE